MAKNALSAAGQRDRSEDGSRSRSHSGKKKNKCKKRVGERSRSRDRSKDRRRSHSANGRKDGAKKRSGRDKSRSRSRSRSRSKKGGKRRGGRKRSRSKSGGRRRSRSKSGGKKRSPSGKKSPMGRRSPSVSKGKPAKVAPKAEVKAGGARSGIKESTSPVRQRSSPSRDRPSKAAECAVSAEGGPDRSEEPANSTRDGQAPVVETPKEEEPAKQPKQGQLVKVKLSERPFGMAPSKEDAVAGYVVAKVAEGRPADGAGVKVGWRLVAVAGKPTSGLDMEGIQGLLKNAELPLEAEFEKPPEDSGVEDDSEADSEEDILDVRANQRMNSDIGLIDELPVKREPEDLPNPIKSWQDACSRGLLNKSLMERLQAAGLKRPTLIQRHTIPIIGHNNGHYDLVASAQTGSGKTFGFVIPTTARLILQGAMPRPFFPGKSPGCPLVLILSPTRELAMQTLKEIEVLTKGSPLVTCCVYGGESLKFQTQRIEKTQLDIVCATPGRLIDLIDANKLSLSFIQSVVLDEADQMFEQSLEIMCAEIMTGRDMPNPEAGRQTLMFSATMPQKIRDLMPKILRQKRMANLTIGHYGDDAGGSCASIKQILRWIPDEKQRIHAMVEDLHKYWMRPGKKGRVVIFTNQRLQASHLSSSLHQQGISVAHLHGKLDQAVREEVFDKFRRGMCDVLVATNVASRGLDFPDISFVVQFNLPQTVDIYTHRIGRTGRVGQVGCALSYMGPKDRHLTGKLIDFMELNKQEVPDFLRELREVDPRRPGGKGRGRSRSRRR